MKKLDFKKPGLRSGKPCRQAGVLLGLMILLLGANSGVGGEFPATEYQVKALFLFNFAKYVEWPAAVFTNASAPITIGVMGTDPFADNLQHAVDGKTINGHAIVIKHLASDSDLNGCQILFISDSESSRMAGILDKARTWPILTVGEDEQFAKNNGIINFVLKDGKVRLEIDLAGANRTGLKISSKLLAVADVVKGKTN